ncbi:MAG: glycosyltransferase 87 family protein, partial [Acidobacteriaceae bacterium]|nr:glycosyltransferase 87 family protein [Acidobacteriaceae bacterium]
MNTLRTALTGSGRWFGIALVIGLVIRVATLVLPGHEDVVSWKIWTYAAAHHVTRMYGVGGDPPIRGIVRWGELWTTVNYPPVFLYEYAIVGKIYWAIFPSFPDSLALTVAVKLPALLANAVLTALLFVTVRRLGGEKPARWVALVYWLNPATLFGGEMLGYLDVLCFLPAVAGLILASFKRPWLAGLLVAIGLATKPQGLLIGPAFALALWQAGGIGAIVSASVSFVATLCLVCAPYYANGSLPNMWLAFGSFDARQDTMSAYGANIGWIINWWLRGKFGIPELGIPRAFMQRVPNPLA